MIKRFAGKYVSDTVGEIDGKAANDLIAKKMSQNLAGGCPGGSYSEMNGNFVLKDSFGTDKMSLVLRIYNVFCSLTVFFMRILHFTSEE